MFRYTDLAIEADQVVDALAGGLLDSDITRIMNAVNDRLAVLRKTRSTDDFDIGCRVVLNSLCGTAYIRGAHATVVDMTKKKLTIKLEKPVGRFVRVVNGITESAEINVPPSIVDRV